MTFHIVTVLSLGSRLSVDRGFLVCKNQGGDEKRLALADVRALVIGVPSVAFTNSCLSRLLAQDSPVLHCDEQYKPIGWTISLDRVIRREVFSNQIAQDKAFTNTLWQGIVRQKMLNQSAVLDYLEITHDLNRLINKPLANEANVSKQYWGQYFEALGQKQKRERKNAETFENKALNYGYAVISTLVHRAILIYGLLPSLGIHHEYRYRSYPLVYDLMEPFRPFVDLFLAKWMTQVCAQPLDADDVRAFTEWVHYLMEALRQCRIKLPEKKYSYKLMDAIDQHVRSVASCFENKEQDPQPSKKLWLPELAHCYWYLDIDNTQEYTNEVNNNDCISI
ncbi:MAG: type II CRISPR-associated endonuclease Cas1 [Vampirovibrionales bacterium]|nr:type II CRISPR-associated endonuclease Cas1 [Vampirovibrionales bacterium]